jgi:hypothetical protein
VRAGCALVSLVSAPRYPESMGAWAKSARLRSEKAKDVAAGSVLVCAIGAAIVRALVLGPPLAALVMK